MIEEILIKATLEECQLCKNNEKFEIEKLAGDASTRKYYRIKCDQSFYVCCLDAPINKGVSDFEEITGFLVENNILVPKIYFSKPKSGITLQEDLGNDMLVNFLSKDFDDDKILTWYKKAIDLIVKMQEIPVDILPKVISSRSFDDQKYKFEMNLTTEYFIEKYLSYSFSESERLAFDHSILDLIKKISSFGKVLVHRDFHSRNLMIKNNELRMIDYQDSMLGTKFYDLVSLLEDTYFPLKLELKRELIEYFKLKVKMDEVEQNIFDSLYDLNSIQRIYKALGSFAYIYHTRDDDRYLKYMGVGVNRLSLLLSSYSELKPLHDVILKAYHEN